jgi:hypothetical protein
MFSSYSFNEARNEREKITASRGGPRAHAGMRSQHCGATNGAVEWCGRAGNRVSRVAASGGPKRFIAHHFPPLPLPSLPTEGPPWAEPAATRTRACFSVSLTDWWVCSIFVNVLSLLKSVNNHLEHARFKSYEARMSFFLHDMIARLE